MNKRFLLYSFISIFCWSLVLNFTNLNYYIKSKNDSDSSKLTVFKSTIYSPDNYWYLNYAKNLISGEGYVQYKNSPKTSVRRTPVYPLFIYIHLKLFGEENAFKIIRITQVLIFALSALILGLAVFNITSNTRLGKATILLYGFNPVVSSYCFYTITESLYPALVCFFIYFITKPKTNANFFYTGMLGGILILTRPLTIIVVLCIIFLFVLFDFIKIRKIGYWIFKYALIFFGILAVLTPWICRNYLVTNGDIVVLEKYYNDHVTEYGRDLLYLAKWAGTWSNPHDIESGYANKIEYYNKNNLFAERDSFTRSWIKKIPSELLINDGDMRILRALTAFNNCQELKQKLYENSNSNKSYIEIEESVNCDEMVKEDFIGLIKEVKRNNPYIYFVKAPLKIFSDLTFHSFSANFLYLNKSSNSNLFDVKAIKSLMYLLNVLLLFSPLFVILLSKVKNNIVWIILFTQIVTYFFLAYSHRRAEVRYILQLYPLMYISFTFFINIVITQIKMHIFNKEIMSKEVN